MKISLKRLFAITLASVTMLCATVISPVQVLADSKQDVCDGIALTSNQGGGCNGDTNGIGSVVRAAITILSLIAGIAAVIMIIIGGVRYITSGGDASSTAAAKNTIIYALVGLIIVALAQVIVRFVYGKIANNG